jgi:isopentenyl-diphosphate delta-isomerase
MALQRDKVILVNERDEQLRTASKKEAHITGVLHRALSIFIVNDRRELLLQRRAADKYHSGGLWSNACCSHPAPGESAIEAAHRRLREELGFDTTLEAIGTLQYQAEVGEGFTEHEYDHLFTGIWNGGVMSSPDEVSAVCWMPVAAIEVWLLREPEQFTAWFPVLLDAWKVRTAAR